MISGVLLGRYEDFHVKLSTCQLFKKYIVYTVYGTRNSIRVNPTQVRINRAALYEINYIHIQYELCHIVCDKRLKLLLRGQREI